MRKRLRQWLPDARTVCANRWLAPFAGAFLHPRLWHLNRRAAAGAVAAGLFCGLIPGPLQMLFAAICALVFRVNLPLAMATTLYTNPVTIVPIYVVAFSLGNLVLGGVGEFVAPPEYQGSLSVWLQSLAHWMGALGKPLIVGLALLACALAAVGYIAVRVLWRIYLVKSWRRRLAVGEGPARS